MDTSSLSGQSGAIDLQFNPGLASGTQAATAIVTQFTGATIDSKNAPSNTGDATGSLPGTLVFNNSKQLNDIFTPVMFGSSFSFIMTLSGPAVDSPNPTSTYGSTFVLGLFSTDGTKPLVTSDGLIATLGLLAGTSSTAVRTFSADASVSPVTSAVPEPSTAFLFVLASAALLLSAPNLRKRSGQNERD